MEQNYSSPLWQGRLLGVLLGIAYAKGVRFSANEDVTVVSLLAKVTSVASVQENLVINQLITIINDKVSQEEASGVQIDAATTKRLQERGQMEAKVVYRDCRDYKKLLEEVDLYAEEEKRLVEIEKSKKRKNRIILACLGAIGLFFLIYNLPFCKEIRAYKAAVASYNQDDWAEYYNNYPRGRHYQDVMYHEVNNTECPVRVLSRYLEKFPEGKYYAEFEGKYNTLWDEEINKYKAREKQGESQDAVNYITAMLHYMKENRIHTLFLKNKANIRLKDYTEYDSGIREFLEYLYTGEALKLNETNMVSLKKNFTQGDQNYLAEILSEGVEKSFGKMFSTKFVEIETRDFDVQAGSPVLSFEYVVENQEASGNIPHIWTYTTNNVPQAYLLGISVRFEAIFTIPGSEITYQYSEIGEPGSEINGISDIKDGYRRMTQRCFAKFSDKMAKNLGLEQTYFN